jgi:hypothetical protein
MNKSERCEPVDEIDDVERERRKRREFIRHLREREARKERYYMNDDEKRERRMRERETAECQGNETEAVDTWLVQRQCVEDIRRSETASVANTTTRAAQRDAELELIDFDYKWVETYVAWSYANSARILNN